MRLAQLGESLVRTPGDIAVLHGLGEQKDDFVVAPEVGEVFERQVDGPGHSARAAEVAQLVGLSLSEGHVHDDPPWR